MFGTDDAPAELVIVRLGGHGRKARSKGEHLMSTAFRVVLEGTQEVPPNHSTASGLGTVSIHSAAVAASYSFRIEGVDYGPATGQTPQTATTDDDVTSTHFHNQIRGMNGLSSSAKSARRKTATSLPSLRMPTVPGASAANGKRRTRPTSPSRTSLTRSVRPRSDRTSRSISTSIPTSSPGARSGVSWSPSRTTITTSSKAWPGTTCFPGWAATTRPGL